MWKTHHDHWYSHPQIDGQENNCDFDDLLSIYNRPIIFGDDYISLYINVSCFHNFHMVSLYFPMGFPHVNVHIARSWDRQGKAFCWPWRCGAIISKDGFHQADIIRWFHNSIVPFRYTYVNVIYIYYTQNLLMYVYWYYCYCYYYYVYIIIYIYIYALFCFLHLVRASRSCQEALAEEDFAKVDPVTWRRNQHSRAVGMRPCSGISIPSIYAHAFLNIMCIYIYMYNYMYNYIVIVWRFADAFPRFVYESMCMMYTLLKNKDDESLFIQRAAWHRLN